MRATAYYNALFDEEGESRASERAPEMKLPGFEAGGAESGIVVNLWLKVDQALDQKLPPYQAVRLQQGSDRSRCERCRSSSQISRIRPRQSRFAWIRTRTETA